MKLAILRVVLFFEVMTAWLFFFSWGILLIGSSYWLMKPFGVYIAVNAWGMFYLHRVMNKNYWITWDDIKNTLNGGG